MISEKGDMVDDIYLREEDIPEHSTDSIAGQCIHQSCEDISLKGGR
jgi:hypothetical protein